MACRGLHLALDEAELAALRAVADEAVAHPGGKGLEGVRLDSPDVSDADKASAFLAYHIGEVLEDTKFDTPDACETDKAWAFIHAALTGTDPDGPLHPAAPHPTANAGDAIAGCEALLDSEDYYIGLIPAADVAAVSAGLTAIPTEELGKRVREVCKRFDTPEDAEEAADYAEGWYPELVTFFATAAKAGKHVLFTVSF